MKAIKKNQLACLLPVAVGLLAGTGPAWSEAPPVPLSDLLGDSDKALIVLQADAAAEAAKQDVERERAESGLRATWGGGYGIVRNIVDEHRAFTYGAAQAQAGFSYPLLGAAEQSDRKVDAALGKQHEQEIRAGAARGLAQLELEAAYARYWGAQESLKVVQAYLGSEDLVMPKLETRAQHKLVLQSETLDAHAAYAQAKGDELRFKRAQDDARNRLERLSGRQLGAFTALPVNPPPAPQVQLDALLARHPDIAALRAQRAALEAQLKDTAWYGIEASLDVTGAGSKDMSKNGGPYGGTAFVGLTFKAPIGVFGARDAEKKGLRAQIEGIRLRIQDRGQELGGEMQSAQQLLAQSQREDEQISQRVRASSESLREGYLRGNVFAEEGVETLVRRLHAYYAAALEEIDTRVKAWQANIALRGYAVADDMAQPASTDVHAGSGADLGAQLADPIIQVDQMLQGHAANGVPLPPAAPAPRAQDENAGPARNAAVGWNRQAPALPPPAAAPAPPPGDSGPRLQSAVYTVAATPAARMPASAPQPPRQDEGDPAMNAAPPQSGPKLQLASNLGAVAASPMAAATGGGNAAMGVYVWHSGELIPAQRDEKFWQGLQNIPVNRLLLGLNAQEIAAAQTDPQQLRGFLEAARRHGIAVELLLGDAGWIEPGQRPRLVAIVNSLRGFDFAGLNLDIEPDQVYQQPLTQAQFDNWMETLRSAARASSWPTAATMHPRYFRDPPYMSWNVEQRLRDAGIGEVVLMIFNSNPQRVAEIARPIVGSPRASGLRFRVAQSVEPELEPQLSYARRSPQDFRQAMQQLQGLLAAQPNTDGVVVQAWNDLMRMGYANQIR